MQNLLSSRVLLVVMVGLVLAALAWMTQIVRTYALARPRGLDPGRRVVGVVLVAALCLLVASPFGYAAQLVNSQRSLLDTLFGGGGALGGRGHQQAAPQRAARRQRRARTTGAPADTMMLASIDTTTARTTIFALPATSAAQFPPGTPMPRGSRRLPDRRPAVSDYLLNAVAAWGLDHPQTRRPRHREPRLNLLLGPSATC